jgi:uncharacterized membrane protein YhiD involved in acid resistance
MDCKFCLIGLLCSCFVDACILHGIIPEPYPKSSAIGVACAGRLYFPATFSVAILLTLLRFGPRLDDSARDMAHSRQKAYSATGSFLPQVTEQEHGEEKSDSELHRLDTSLTNSFRNRASLGGIL